MKSENAILFIVPDLRSCTVSFRDALGIHHSVEVSAESLYEAAALALKAFQSAQLMPAEWGTATELEICSRPPTVRHCITIHKVQNWLQSAGKSPREQALKSRLRDLLSP